MSRSIHVDDRRRDKEQPTQQRLMVEVLWRRTCVDDEREDCLCSFVLHQELLYVVLYSEWLTPTFEG